MKKRKRITKENLVDKAANGSQAAIRMLANATANFLTGWFVSSPKKVEIVDRPEYAKAKAKQQAKVKKIKEATQEQNKKKYPEIFQRKVKPTQEVSKAPKPYPLANEQRGEKNITIECVHAHCESGGSFQISDKAYQWYLDNGILPPKNCYKCKVWAYELRDKYILEGSCECCGRKIGVKVKDWIGYHKFKGKPEFTVFCSRCRYERFRERELGEEFGRSVPSNPLTRHSIDKVITKNLHSFKTKLPSMNISRVLSRVNHFSSKAYSVDRKFILRTTHTNYSTVYNVPKIKTKSGATESRAQHIEQHMSGIKDLTMASYGTVDRLIERAMDLACSTSSSVYTIPKGDKIIKFDLNTGEKFVYQFNHQYDMLELVTAYRPKSMLNMVSDKLLAYEITKEMNKPDKKM